MDSEETSIGDGCCLALVGGACGGDDDVADDAGARESGASIGDADSGDAGDRDASGGNDRSGAIWPVEAEDDLLEGVDFTDPEALEVAYQSMIDLVEDAAESAPEEVRPTSSSTVERSKVIFGALSDADFNILDVDQAVFETPRPRPRASASRPTTSAVRRTTTSPTTDAIDDRAPTRTTALVP